MDNEDPVAYKEERRRIIASLPEFTSFEDHKENILPLRQGRSAGDLVTYFQMDPETREVSLQEGHESFRRELEKIDELDDPLDVYIRYINWTMKMYPQGQNQESDLVGLLYEVTDRFKNREQYKEDIRYLKCWIQYAEYLDNPSQMYSFLMQNSIGQTLALFYEAYARFLESCQK